jgi:putative SOS response-associated peptidase YedK
MLGVYPDSRAPIVRNGTGGERELALARWGMPSPQNVQFEAAKKRAEKLEAKGKRRLQGTAADGAR